MRKQQKGFTLIELLVVIAIIGLLSTLAVVSFSSAQTRARDANRVSDVRQFQTAMESYNAQYATYNVGEKYATNCVDAKIVSGCDNAELKVIIPQISQLNDPDDTIKSTICTNGLATGCNYAFGPLGTTTYKVFFRTENNDVQGLKTNSKAHTLSELGMDPS